MIDPAISVRQRVRLESLGVVFDGDTMIATEEQLWRAGIIGETRTLLVKRGQLTITSESSAPDWLPEGADHFIGFKDAHYWMSGAEVTAADMIGSDETYGTHGGVGNISAGVGYTDGDTGSNYDVALLGAARDAVLAGATLVFTFTTGTPASMNNPSIYMEIVDVDFNTDLFIRCRHGSAGFINDGGAHTVALETLTAGSHKLAVTVSPSRMAGSQDGVDPAVGFTPTIAVPPTIAVFAAQWGAVIESIAIYETPKDDADLPALSSVPWWPANAKIHIDFVNDRAWTEADGEVAINTLLGTDPNTVNGWGATSYDAGNLTADGYNVGEGNGPAFIGSALTKMMEGATIVHRTKQVAGTNHETNFALLSVDGNDALAVDTNTWGTGNIYLWNNDVNLETVVVCNAGIGSINQAAFTYRSGSLDLSVNGCEAVSGSAENVFPGLNPVVCGFIGTNADDRIQSITIYDALPSTAGLSALSETGVTNTAPSAITLVWIIPVSEVDATHATVGTQLPGGNQLFESLTMVDAEGNPPTWTLTDDDDGKFQYQGFVNSVSAIETLGPGVYHFTLRATDPGGLYVEQEFTITVLPTPIALFDFDNATYTVNGSPVAVTDGCATDGESGAVFDPADVVASGLRTGNNGGTSHPAFIGGLLAAMLGTVGSTIVVDLDAASGDYTLFSFDAFNSPTWDADVTFSADTVSGQIHLSGATPATPNPTGSDVLAFSGAGRVKVAFTFSATHLSGSVNGGAATTLNVDDVADWSIFTKLYMNTSANYIRSITVYEPQLAAALPALSAL